MQDYWIGGEKNGYVRSKKDYSYKYYSVFSNDRFGVHWKEEVVESYTKKNKHLADIPSAKEIEKKGLSVSNMLAKQMQKIEELTLYLIDLKKENDSLKARVIALESRN